MSRLQENLDEILRQKQTYLKPENIRQGITAYGVEGAMTSENMWLPQYSSEGDYYILSFVNLDGNSNVEKIIGYDGYRIVKFVGDNKMYLFDVRMNKPKQLTNDLPKNTTHLLGYTDTDVYTLYCPGNTSQPKVVISKFNLQNSTVEKVYEGYVSSNSTSATYCYLPSVEYYGQSSVVRDFVVFGGFYSTDTNSSYWYGWGTLAKYNFAENKFDIIKGGTSYDCYTCIDNTSYQDAAYYCPAAVKQIENNIIFMCYCSYGNSRRKHIYIYNLDTKKLSNFSYTSSSGDFYYIRGISPSGNYLFAKNNIYNLDLSQGTLNIGAKIEGKTTPFSDTNYGMFIEFITSTVCMYKGKLYKYDEETLTFTQIVDTTFYNPQISNTYLDVITGYEFLGKKYYFNTGSSIIKSNKILEGYFARDQYNQTIQGAMPNHGSITINPSIATQTITEGYTSGITVNPVTYEIDSDIKPENIRYGVNILGVAGTLEQDAAESVMSQEEYDACMTIANNILGITE